MTHRDHLIEQHIRFYESHLAHIDEMLDRAWEHVEAGSASPATESELKDLKGEREKLAGNLSEMQEAWKHDPLSWSGPMALWHTVMQRLERLMERLD